MKIKLIITSLLIQFLIGCSSTPINIATIKIKGSDTMLYLADFLAQDYMKEHPGISIYVDGGGTASGVRSLINGEIDICTASRYLEAEEVKLLAENFGSVGISYLIAKDGLCIYLNEKNTVKNISLNDLKNIFTGSITNWKQIGGSNESIKLIIRNPNSGTHLYFKEHVLGDNDYSKTAITVISTKKVIEEVSENKDAIGYGGVAFKHNLQIASINGVQPTEENIRKDIYPISRYLHFYTLNQPTGHIKDFIDWVLSPKGQNIVKQVGFIPLFELPY
jgi:phosphate transport system substrate-binding protein